MIHVLRQILENAVERLVAQATTYLPPLLAAAALLFVAFVLASLAYWLLMRAVKAIALDRFLIESGLSSMLPRSRRIRGSQIIAGAAYWGILLVGVLAALNVFGTALTTEMIGGAVVMLPKVLSAAAIMLAGFWFGRYLGRSTLLWACNEDLPSPRTFASAVRLAITFVAVVVASDVLGFASSVFLAAFILCAGGAVLAASLAFGLGFKEVIREHFASRSRSKEEEPERSLWTHL
jgi:hypothetical protein